MPARASGPSRARPVALAGALNHARKRCISAGTRFDGGASKCTVGRSSRPLTTCMGSARVRHRPTSARSVRPSMTMVCQRCSVVASSGRGKLRQTSIRSSAIPRSARLAERSGTPKLSARRTELCTLARSSTSPSIVEVVMASSTTRSTMMRSDSWGPVRSSVVTSWPQPSAKSCSACASEPLANRNSGHLGWCQFHCGMRQILSLTDER